MNIIKIIDYIKNICFKQKEIKRLIEPKTHIEQDKEVKFKKDLKVTTIQKTRKKEIETLICKGDGLGIQKKITS